MDIWQRLYEAARAVQADRALSPFIQAGGVAAAILTRKGNIYLGVCMDTASSLGMCAERAAIANMVTCGEQEIDKLVAVMPDGRVGPCLLYTSIFRLYFFMPYDWMRAPNYTAITADLQRTHRDLLKFLSRQVVLG